MCAIIVKYKIFLRAGTMPKLNFINTIKFKHAKGLFFTIFAHQKEELLIIRNYS